MKFETNTVVYVVLNERFGMMKIGITKNIHKRKRSIENSCGCKVETLAVTPEMTKYQAETIERYLHQKYDDHRLEGEWFEYIDEAAQVDVDILYVYSWHEKVAREGPPKLKGLRKTN